MPKKVTAKPQADGSVLIEELIWKTKEGAYRARRRGRGGAMRTFPGLAAARKHRDSAADTATDQPVDATLTMAKVQAEYFALRQDWSAATRNQAVSNWTSKLRGVVGALHPDAVTVAHVMAVRNSLRGADRSQGTVKNVLTLLGQLVNFAVLQGYRTKAGNPVTQAKLVKAEPRTGEGRKRAMTRELVDAFFAALDDRAEPAAQVAYHCGLRNAEVRRLQVRHIDFMRGSMDVPGTKSRAAVRTVPVPRHLLDAIAASLPQGSDQDTFIVRNTRGGPMGPKTLEDSWNVARAAVGSDARFHDLRHSFCTDLLDAGVPVQTVAELAGHASPSITLDVYAHSTDTGRAAALAAMTERFAQSGTIGAQSAPLRKAE
jgi:integrase